MTTGSTAMNGGWRLAMLPSFKVAAIVALLVLLAGCAAQTRMATPQEDRAAKEFSVPSQKAVVYVYRDGSFLAQARQWPVAVDGKVFGWLAPRTYYRLILDPGAHELETRDVIYGRSAGKSTVSVTLEPGKMYFVRLHFLLRFPLQPELLVVDGSEAMNQIKTFGLARFDNKGDTLDALMRKPVPRESANPQPVAPANNEDSSISILEILGGVLLVGLLVLGAAAGNHHSDATDYSLPPPPSAIARPATSWTKGPIVPTAIQTSSGGALTVSNGNFYGSNGRVWRSDGGTIRGSDGSVYSVSGDRIVSQDGRSFRSVGNTLIGSDGSTCQIIGVVVSCK